MYRAIYSYTSSDDNVLSFENGDVFNLVEQIDEHWWSMLDQKGLIGLVPATYLEISKISQEEVIKFIDASVELFQRNAALQNHKSSNGTERRNLQKILKHRQAIESGNSLWKSRTSSTTEIPQQPKRTAPKAPTNGVRKGRSSKRWSAPPPPSSLSSGESTPTSSPRVITTSQSFDYGSPVQKSPNTYNKGASSSTYNLHVSRGEISPLQSGTFSRKQHTSNSNSDVNSDVYVVSVEKSTHNYKKNKKETSNSNYNKPDILNTSNMNQFQGKHITISRTNDANFVAIQSPEKTVSNIAKHFQDEKLNARQVNSQENPESAADSISERSFSISSAGTDTMNLSPFKKIRERDVEVPDDIGSNLIDAVRTRCKISFNKSLAAVRCVLNILGNEIPSISTKIQEIELQMQDDTLNVHHGSLAKEDANRLYEVLEQLVEHKEDSQQRGWAVHEDFVAIKELLENLVTVMDEIDPSICRSVLEEDECRYINELIVYYQMETRAKLRISLLHVFGCFCQLGSQFISTLLCSVFPTELAQDLLQDQEDILKFLSSSLMLMMIFSTGEPVPYHHYAQLNEDFITFILDTVEDPPDSDKEDQVSDSLIGFLLAFNLHFKAPRHNIVIQALSKRKIFRTLSEKILLLINREVDPVALFPFSTHCPDSVLKFLIDIFASKQTSGIFFTNDLYVLLDIILRQLTDRSKQDKMRTEYLSLFHSILNTTNYTEHKYRAGDFNKIFVGILQNNDTESEVDFYIVKEIITRFASVFG